MIKFNRFSKLTIFILVLILFTGCSKKNLTNSNLKSIDINDWKNYLDENSNIIVLDVRTKQEFEQGHIKGAINIDFYNKNFREEIKKLDKNKTYLIYCRSGVRSYKTLKLMDELNFINVLDLKGGILAWVNKNYLLVK